MTGRDESLLRQIYLTPDCLTIKEVWQEWRSRGNWATFEEVRDTLWNLPEELLTYRSFDLSDVDMECRKIYLQDLELGMLQTWRSVNKGYRIPGIEQQFVSLLLQVQRNIRDLVMQGVPV